MIEQALRAEPPGRPPEPPGSAELLGQRDWLKAVAIGVIAGGLLRAGFELSVSRSALLFLGAAAGAQDAHAVTLIRLWMLGGVLVTLGAGAFTAVIVRTHPVLWAFVSMACVAIPLLTP